MAKQLANRGKKWWEAYKNVAAVHGFLQWIGKWNWAVAVMTAVGSWFWARAVHLKGPEQFALALFIGVCVLLLIKLAQWVFSGTKPVPTPVPMSLPAQAETLPPNRPQLLIVKWGRIDSAKAERGAHVVQHGFYIQNIGLGETAIGVKVALEVPTEVSDVWSNGEGATPTVAIGKDDKDVFVPVWRKLGMSMFSRWDLQEFLVETYQGKLLGNKEIPVTIRYSSNGKKYVTRQNLIYSPEQKQIVGFGDPVQTIESDTSQ